MLKNDSPRSIAAQYVWLVKFVMTPRAKFDPAIPHFRRLRPGYWPLNNAILLYATLWNILFLPVTLAARYQDQKKVVQARALLQSRLHREKSARNGQPIAVPTCPNA
jgi:hypothetical protein